MSENAIEKFIETMGLMAQSDGGTRISGQVYGYLLVAGEPRTLQQMTEALSISKASASTNCRSLEGRGMLRRVSHLGARQDAWAAVSDPHRSLLTRLVGKFRKNAQDIAAIAEAFPAAHADARTRVEGLCDFYRDSADLFEEWLARIPAARDLASASVSQTSGPSDPNVSPADSHAPNALAGRATDPAARNQKARNQKD